MRLLVLKEDYCGACLVMTDCDNEQLTAILEKAIENDENGIGQTVTEICNELFPLMTMTELGCTEQSEFYDITELNVVCVASVSYLGFGVVQSELE